MASYSTLYRLRGWVRTPAGPASRLRARVVAAYLARELVRHRSSEVVSLLVDVAAGPPGRAASRAFRALQATIEDPELLAEVAYHSLLRSRGDGPRAEAAGRVWSSVVTPLLLAPTPPGRHVPHIRLVALIDALPEDPPPVPRQWVESSPTARQRVISSMWSAAMHHAPLREVLGTTDCPPILDVLAAQWRSVHGPRFIAEAVANPHLVPRQRGDVLLAMAKNRLDLLDENQMDTADGLVNGARLFGAIAERPADAVAPYADQALARRLANSCRQHLRGLGPGAVLDWLCELATGRHGESAEALAAITEARHIPGSGRDRVLFLFLHEQWEHYEAADPDGELIHEAWCTLREGRYNSDLLERISEVARRTHRPDPERRWRREHEARQRSPRTRGVPNPSVPFSGMASGAGIGGVGGSCAGAGGGGG